MMVLVAGHGSKVVLQSCGGATTVMAHQKMGGADS